MTTSRPGGNDRARSRSGRPASAPPSATPPRYGTAAPVIAAAGPPPDRHRPFGSSGRQPLPVPLRRRVPVGVPGVEQVGGLGAAPVLRQQQGRQPRVEEREAP